VYVHNTPSDEGVNPGIRARVREADRVLASALNVA
jgi:hypothetical protein